MVISRGKLKMSVTTFSASLAIAARLALAALALAAASLTAQAADSPLSKQDKECLECHATKGLEKKLANGEMLSLHVDGSGFAKSVHSMIGCAVCHREIAVGDHPPLKKKISSLRDNSIELTKVCFTCHSGVFKLYKNSIHATLVREGDTAAPLCTDCHSPHTVMAKAAFDAKTGAPCSNCHFAIQKAYAGSVHGQASLGCSSCHNAHDVSATTAEDKLKNACFGCHSDLLQAHQAWLPNAERHFEAVSCPACHVPGAKRKVDLRLFSNDKQQRITEQAGVPQFIGRARSADGKEKGLSALELQDLLREFNPAGTDQSKTTLRGRLEVSTGVEAHQLAEKSQAIRDCATCHQQGAAPFQSVTVSIIGPDGRPLRHEANKEVLNSPISVEAVGGFYVIGGTRIKALDILLVLALLGGVSVPIGHLTLTWLFKRNAKRIGGEEDS
jgi:predicted CXXCH cytochrome family protein